MNHKNEKEFIRPAGMAIITSKINERVYMKILNIFLLTSIEIWFDDKEVIFQHFIT